MPGVDLHHYFVAMRDFVTNWWPLLGLTFYGLLIYIFWRMLQLMPRVKPAEVDTTSKQAVTWSDVAGVDEVRAELQEVVDFLRNPSKFERLGARVPKGILLHGPPGTGKTLLAKAAANESGAAFFAASASSFIEMFAGLGAARIRRLFKDARKKAPASFAGREDQNYVTQENFDAAMERIVAGLQKRRVVTEKEKRVLAFHEAGHAVMSYLMGELMPLHKVSIVGRGEALGYAYYLPTEDRYVRTKEELNDSMKITLAGRAAEQVVFGRISTGAADDLQKVTELARSMVFEYGMSDMVASRTMRADNYALSEETKSLRDQEQARLTDGAFAESVRLLTKHRVSLDRVASALLQKETLVREEVLELLEDVPAESHASETVGMPRVVSAEG